jgi:hypothetical protein
MRTLWKSYSYRHPLRFDRIIVDHAVRQPDRHVHFIIFLLTVIGFCLLMLASI